MRNRLFLHSIKNDSVLGRLKFVAKIEDNQVYGMLIPDVMLNKEIQNSKAYHTYLGFSTRAVNPKKARKGTKAVVTPKKKGSFTADDNIIPDLDIALELGYDEEFDESDAEPTRRPTRRRRQTRVVFRDTYNVSKKKTPAQSQKLKGMEMLSDAALLEAETKKAIKASRPSSGSSSFNSSENSTDNMIPSILLLHLAILTLSPVLPPSLLFDPRYFFIPEELLPPKKRICSSSSSSTTLSNSSQNQTCNLVSPSSSVYTPTPPQIFEIGKCPIKMYLKHHEGQIEDILNYLNELYLHHIEKMEEGRIDRMIIRRNSDELKTELKRIRTQIIKLQKKQLGQKDKIAFAHYRISDLEQIIEKIQARHQTDQEDL
ncbi:hypothetical protein Tco_1227495 [Tanacetum coccineum]